MIIHRAHKIRLRPTPEQESFLRRACGCARVAYNWAVEHGRALAAAGQRVDAMALKKQFNAEKKTLFPWMMESPKDANQQAFARYAKALAVSRKGGCGPPVFHRKGERDAFYVSCDKFRMSNGTIRLPKLAVPIKTAEDLRFSGKILSCVVNRDGDRWFASVSVEIEVDEPAANDSVVGVDVGIKTIAVASDGTTCENPKALRRSAGKIRHYQRALSRRTRGSCRWKKARESLRRVYRKVKDRRNDLIHKFTTALAKNHGTAVIETLSIKGMFKGFRSLRRALSEAAMGEVHRQLVYKMSHISKADRWQPTSKTCSRCGHRFEGLTLAARHFQCAGCGREIDRDLNAAENLANNLRVAHAH